LEYCVYKICKTNKIKKDFNNFCYLRRINEELFSQIDMNSDVFIASRKFVEKKEIVES